MMNSFSELLSKIKEGDETAFGDLYMQYCNKIDNFIFFRAGRDYEDIASEVWIGVSLKINDFEGSEGQFQAWLYRIARNRIADYFRKKRISTVDIDMVDSELAEELTIKADNDLPLIANEEIAEMNAFLKKNLTSKEYEILFLRVMADCSVKEVAEMTERTETAVRLLQHRALKKLSRLAVIKPPEVE